MTVLGGATDYLFEAAGEKEYHLLESSQDSTAHPSDKRSMKTKKRNGQRKAVELSIAG